MAHPEVKDIIYLKEGDKVHTYIPESLYFRSDPFSGYPKKEVEVYVGQVHHEPLATREHFIEQLTEHLKCELHYDTVTQEKVSKFVNSLELDFSLNKCEIFVPSGEYRVYQANSVAGHPRRNDVSYFVYCEKVDNPNIRCYYSYIIG